ncbi:MULTISPECIES: ubiquitin-like protein Pup [Bifidobacterium]|uniref:ubiquitin-like protein Pup n=1 Tax=Bifidobacterium TaxID=1678 RepID=UPI001BDD37C4|nr:MULTISPECIES: ubiquitin-like protein Pup [Bifidobacterium]MBT1161052.1 ubiquitin-like protein Pup [Bifidobacterium sp. SO1]MBW3078128.1 ubiquitin-like protein Pup [Bifidobacterium simiiventris]
MPQEFVQGKAEQAVEHGEETTRVEAVEAQETGDVLDSVLDDIESVLETNAEEYVNSFVQKGGE